MRKLQKLPTSLGGHEAARIGGDKMSEEPNVTISITSPCHTRLRCKMPFFSLTLLLILSLVSGLGFTADETSKKNAFSNVRWLQFSQTAHSRERTLIMAYEKISPADLKKGHIFIALADLDEDNTDEIFAYIDIFDFCGQSEGCPFNIYRVRDGRLTSLLHPEFSHGFPIRLGKTQLNKQGGIGVASRMTSGWHDIAIDREVIWRWNGKYYSNTSTGERRQ
jgi:hypothetical protein